MFTGTVKSFNHKKCYGFIIPSTGGKEIFVHATRLREEIHEGDEVRYEIRETAKGPEAVHVRVVRLKASPASDMLPSSGMQS